MLARKITSIAWRYILPLLAFALILLASYAARHYFSFNLDFTSLVIVLMVATAWYLGLGPAQKDRRKALSSGYQIRIAKPIDPAAIAAVAEIKKKL